MDANGELIAPELALLRTHPQRTDLYLAIPTYTALFTAVVVAPTPVNNDGVYQVTFALGSGAAFSSVDFWMTVLVGTLPGGSDIGIARIRKAITSGDGGITGTIYIGTTSEIEFVAGQHLTVTNEMGLWPRHPYVDPATSEEFMDYEIDYVAQHTYFSPIPNMFPSAVAHLPTGGTVSVEFNSKDSWSPYIPELAYPADYTFVWTCVGPAAATVVTPAAALTDITFSNTGTYLVKLVLTANYGGGNTAASSGYRYVIVYDDANPLIKSPVLESCSGDFDNGGWSYRVTCHSQAELDTIHNRTLCILVADDWYGTTHQSIGPIVDRENVVCLGWIDGESITRSNDTGNVSFDVQGPQWWFDKMQGYPTGVDDSLVDPAGITGWTMIKNLTARKGLWHFILWRTTAVACMDIPSVARHGFAALDTRRLATTYTPAGSLWEQLRAIADRIFARATCNRYGQLFINVDSQLVDPAIRGTHPNILGAAGFADADWRDEITIERRTVPEAALVDLSGIFWSGTVATSSALFSLAPGHYFKHYGRPATRDRITLTDQAESNLLAGLYLGWLNNEYPNVDVPLSANNRCFDIAPYMFSWMTIAAGDTPREIEWTNKRLIPRRVSFERDAGEAVMLADVTFESETFANAAMIGDPPIAPPSPPTPPPPPCVCDDSTATNFGGDCPCLYSATRILIMHNSKHVLRCMNYFDLTSAAVWSEVAVTGIAAGDTICSLAIDPDGLGAWLVTTGADLDTTGVFRCSDITTGTFALVLSQSDSQTKADAARAALGYGSWPSIMYSCISFGDGKACVPEATGYNTTTNPPSCAFASNDSGGSWTATCLLNPAPHTLGYPCFWNWPGHSHTIDWDGSTIYLSGFEVYTPTSEWFRGVLATSADGIAWSFAYIPPCPPPVPVNGVSDLFSCNVAGGVVYILDNTFGDRLIDSAGNIIFDRSIAPYLTYTEGFRRTSCGADVVQILYPFSAIAGGNTGLYQGLNQVLISGGGVATVAVVNGGTGGTYAPGDILTLLNTWGGVDATVTVLTVAGDDVVTVGLTTPGTGYRVATFATSGGGGTGCTISVTAVTDDVPLFGVARVLGTGEFVLAARDTVSVTGVVSVYIIGGIVYDRTGNLLAICDWLSVICSANNTLDASGIEAYYV